MNSKLKAILSIPKIVWVNFRYLPFKQAIKIPILIAYNADFKCVRREGVRLDAPISFGMIHIGFFTMNVCNPKDKTIVDVKGSLVFKGKAALGHGTKITVYKSCEMILGDSFHVSGYSSFVCKKKMVFGNNVLFGWECLTMDGDGHTIYDINNQPMIGKREVVFGDNVWVGCRCTILKGALIPSGSIIGAGTIIAGQKFEPQSIIAGNPPHVIKKISRWKM